MLPEKTDGLLLVAIYRFFQPEKFMIRLLCIPVLILFLFYNNPPKDLPQTVTESRMQEFYELVKTPYKYGLILVPDSIANKMDCPTVFKHDDHWGMTYIVFDCRGYETYLAQSENLIQWELLGPIMQFSDTTDWDVNQKAGYPALIDYEWGGNYTINNFDNKYWMSYFGGDSRGYERGLLSIGMAYTEKNPAQRHQWNRLNNPVLMSTDSDARWCNNYTMYKSSVIEDNERLTGHRFVMYYSAKGDSLNTQSGAERISMAVSDDMVNWKRFGTEPLINHHKEICGDVVIQKIDALYVMFYFGAFWPDHQVKAFNRFACSYDLVHWTEWKGPHFIEPSEKFDNLFAHKSCVIKTIGIFYHFYNAVNTLGNRGIALAMSTDLGKSNLSFNSRVESYIK